MPVSLVGLALAAPAAPSGTPRLNAWRPAVAVGCVTSTSSLAGQRVDDRDADAVQAAGDLVAAAAELAAGVQHGEHHLDRRACSSAGCGVDRDAAAVVDRPGRRRRPAASRRSGRSGRPSPRRRSCRRPPTRGGAGRARRSSRCTCPGACGPPRGPRAPGSRRRRTCRPRPRGPRSPESSFGRGSADELVREGRGRQARVGAGLGGCRRASLRPRAILFTSAHIEGRPRNGERPLPVYPVQGPDPGCRPPEGASATRRAPISGLPGRSGAAAQGDGSGPHTRPRPRRSALSGPVDRPLAPSGSAVGVARTPAVTDRPRPALPLGPCGPSTSIDGDRAVARAPR